MTEKRNILKKHGPNKTYEEFIAFKSYILKLLYDMVMNLLVSETPSYDGFDLKGLF